MITVSLKNHEWNICKEYVYVVLKTMNAKEFERNAAP
jgi:hypothetical protein